MVYSLKPSWEIKPIALNPLQFLRNTNDHQREWSLKYVPNPRASPFYLKWGLTSSQASHILWDMKVPFILTYVVVTIMFWTLRSFQKFLIKGALDMYLIYWRIYIYISLVHHVKFVLELWGSSLRKNWGEYVEAYTL